MVKAYTLSWIFNWKFSEIMQEWFFVGMSMRGCFCLLHSSNMNKFKLFRECIVSDGFFKLYWNKFIFRVFMRIECEIFDILKKRFFVLQFVLRYKQCGVASFFSTKKNILKKILRKGKKLALLRGFW